MKTRAIGMFLAIGAVAVLGTTLNAQTYGLTAEVPFAFQVGNQVFAPGDYHIHHGSQGVPTIRSAQNGHAFFISGASPALGTARSAKLVFHCYAGQKCFLAEIWSDTVSGSAVPKSQAEKSLALGDHAREMATIAIDLHRAD